MLIYLDTKDLIDLFEYGRPCDTDTFARLLAAGGHQLVLSLSNVREISRPLLDKTAKTIVMSLLNRIEAISPVYIREGGIFSQKLEEALAAFSEGRECNTVSPLVKRFDEASVQWGQPSAAMGFVKFPLAEAVFWLWQTNPKALTQNQWHSNHLREIIESDRRMEDPPDLAEHFVVTVGRHMADRNLSPPSVGLEAFAKWVYHDTRRCPSIRLSYEVFDSLRRNPTDVPKDGDILDFAHLGCIPYVDLITLDARIGDYLRRVYTRIIPGCKARVCADLGDLLKRLPRGT